MKTLAGIILAGLALTGSIFWAQTRPEAKPAPAVAAEACGLNHADLKDEVQDLNAYTARMQARIVMIRNGAGTVQNPQVRDALQVDAEMWQDEADHLKRRAARLQSAVDRCEGK